MVNKRKKTQQTLPGFRAASEGRRPSANIGVTTWYYICDKLSTTMLIMTPHGLMEYPHELQEIVPALFTLGAARKEYKRWKGLTYRRWPYNHPSEWPDIQARW